MRRAPILVPDPGLGLCHLTLAFDMGSMADPLGREGASHLLFRLLRRTHPRLSSDELEAEWDRLGASLSVETSRTVSAFHLVVLSRSVSEALHLLAECLGAKRLSPEEFRMLQEETLDHWLESLDDDSTLARRAFSREFYRGHPFERLTGGTHASLSALELEDLLAVRRTILCRQRAHVALSGSVSPEVEASLARLVETLPERVPESLECPEPEAAPGRRLVYLEKPQRSQAQIIVGCQGARADDEDMVALHMGHTIFGGTFGARLSEEVRVKRGWSYGAYSHLPIDRKRQAFWFSTAVRIEDAPDCMSLLLELFRAFVEKGVSDDELIATRRYLENSHAFSLDTAAKRAGSQLDQTLHGHLPPEDYLDRVRQTTAQDVNEAIARRLSTESSVISVLGPPGPLLDALRSHADVVTSLAHDRRD